MSRNLFVVDTVDLAMDYEKVLHLLLVQIEVRRIELL
jgi:hypothetical protein